MADKPVKYEFSVSWPAGTVVGTVVFTPAPPPPPGPVTSIQIRIDPPGPRPF